MTRQNKIISRRQFVRSGLGTIAGLGVAGLSSRLVAATGESSSTRKLSEDEIPFIGMTEDGPLYPPVEIPWDDDLTSNGITGGRAKGTTLYLFGMILTRQGRPLANATVEIWHTDFNGNYRHPRGWAQDQLDPNFGYFGKVKTNSEGFYFFKTIRPRWYQLVGFPNTPADGIPRAAHIHMKIRHKDHGVTTTEAYFDNASHEEIAPQDRVFLSRPKAVRDKILLPENSPKDYRELGFDFEENAICCRYDMAYLL